MAKTPEARVKDLVKATLKEFDCYQFWPVQSGYGSATVDCLGSAYGLFFAIETKAPGKKPTPRQELVLGQVHDTGAVTFVIDGPEGVEALRQWLEAARRMAPHLVKIRSKVM